MIFERLFDPSVWEDFYASKSSGGFCSTRELAALRRFIDCEGYSHLRDKFAQNDISLSTPRLMRVNKSYSEKKRVVYCYSEDEMYLLKLVAYLLKEYDGIFPHSCYSFRSGTGAKAAFRSLTSRSEAKELYCYKADISDYFNSICPDRLYEMLCESLDDCRLLTLFGFMLLSDEAVDGHKTVHVKKGAMAGTPTAGFFANLYLAPLDRHFEALGLPYARYSDDLILFASEADIPLYRQYIADYLAACGLSVNKSKEEVIAPHQSWHFLGFSYANGVIDIAPSSLFKIKHKIKRYARKLRRRIERGETASDRALKIFNARINRKFYGSERETELNWSRWYFPVITTADSLGALDRYVQDCERFLLSGRYCKADRKKYPYSLLKDSGYRPLVPEYYIFRNNAPDKSPESEKNEG